MNPETREHILNQQRDGGEFHCGCWYRTDRTLSLCAYHQGYDEGIDMLRPAEQEPTLCTNEPPALGEGHWHCCGQYLPAEQEPTP